MRQHAVSRLRDPASLSRHRDAIELMLLHRRSPLEPQVRQLRDSGVLAVVPAAPADRAGVLEIVSGAEGPGGRADRTAGGSTRSPPACTWPAPRPGWRPSALHVYVSPEDNPVPEDPVVRAVLDAIERRSPLRPGERVGICRAMGNRGTYQRDALAVLAGSVSSLVEWLSRPVAWTVVTAPHEDFWRPFFEYLGFGVLARVRFGAGDVTAYGWDRRRLPLEEFLELTGRRELTGETGPPPAELLRPAPLGRDAFEEAVRAALRDVNRPDRLAASPLAGTALGPGPAGVAAGRDRPARRRAEGRAAAPGAGPDVPVRDAEPGGGGRGAGPAVQHVPALPRPGHRPAGRRAVGGRSGHRLSRFWPGG